MQSDAQYGEQHLPGNAALKVHARDPFHENSNSLLT